MEKKCIYGKEMLIYGKEMHFMEIITFMEKKSTFYGKKCPAIFKFQVSITQSQDLIPVISW